MEGQSPFGGLDFSSIAGMGDNLANFQLPEEGDGAREPDSDDEEEEAVDAQQ